MKKLCIIFSVFIIFLSVFYIGNFTKTYASENVNSDQVIGDILSGIDEENFQELVDELNLFFNTKKGFREWVYYFFTGQLNINSNMILEYLKDKFLSLSTTFFDVVILIIIIGIVCSISNIIIAKNCDNTMKNTIFFICYSLSVFLTISIITKLFTFTENTLNNITKITTICFPVIFSLILIIGNFGVELFKPFTVFSCLFATTISSSVFLPILSVSCAVSMVGSINENVKFNVLKNSLLHLYKWGLGIITGIFSILLTCQGLVNVQYNGVSVKILKYLSGTLIPVVGGFISGGVDVMLSSSIMIKNSLGLFSLIYILITSLSSSINLLVFSFVLKFLAGVGEPILDSKFTNIITLIGEVATNLSSLIFLTAFMFVILILFVILSTFLIV